MSAWLEHVERWKDCTNCPLCQQRDRICLARGVLPADVVFVGEAPGASEDALGEPFRGPAGKLLDQIIDRALPTGTRFALTNLVACFPREAKGRGDNQPESEEIKECEPRLIEFVNIARPKLIVCVGRLVTQWIDHDDTVKCVDIDHPAFILRMPLAQKGMATQKAIVVLRCAVEDVMGRSQIFTKWGNGNHADITTLKYRHNHVNESDIPF